MDLLKMAMAITEIEKKQAILEDKQFRMEQTMRILISNTRKAYAYAEALRRILVAKNVATDEETVKQFEAEVKVLLEREQYEMEKQKKKLQIVRPAGVIIRPGG